MSFTTNKMIDKFLLTKRKKFLIKSWEGRRESVFKEKLRQGIKSFGRIRILTDDGDDFYYIKITKRTNGIYTKIFETTVGINGCLEVGALIAAWEYCYANKYSI